MGPGPYPPRRLSGLFLLSASTGRTLRQIEKGPEVLLEPGQAVVFGGWMPMSVHFLDYPHVRTTGVGLSYTIHGGFDLFHLAELPRRVPPPMVPGRPTCRPAASTPSSARPWA